MAVIAHLLNDNLGQTHTITRHGLEADALLAQAILSLKDLQGAGSRQPLTRVLELSFHPNRLSSSSRIRGLRFLP
jgi:hypothetical protein